MTINREGGERKSATQNDKWDDERKKKKGDPSSYGADMRASLSGTTT